MLRKLVLVFFVILPILSFANQPNLDDILVQNNQRVGKVEFKKWFFHVYNAELFTKNGSFSWDKPFVLKIHYLMGFKSKTIAIYTAIWTKMAILIFSQKISWLVR